MSDDLGFGDSPWGDQTSHSTHHNSHHHKDSDDAQSLESREVDYASHDHAAAAAEEVTTSEETTAEGITEGMTETTKEEPTHEPILTPLPGTTADAPQSDDTVTAATASSDTRRASTTAATKKTRPSVRSRKIKPVAIYEQSTDSNPLGPLGEQIESLDLKKDGGDTTTISAPGPTPISTSEREFHDIPLSGEDKETGSVSPTMDRHLDDGSRRRRPSGVSAASSSPIQTEGPAGAEPDIDFHITVDDPIKVGDITSAHTVYTVHCKTNCPSFAKSETSVTRRYRDFRWLFHALEGNNLGVVVPPPPEKQAVGRFDEEFVEQRRAALETMLVKISHHPILKHDADFRLFLESDHFTQDSKARVVSPEELELANQGGAASSAGSMLGSLGTAFSFSGKFIETSQWFVDHKTYIDGLEAQLRGLSKGLELVVNQRRELCNCTSEFGRVIESLADVELSKTLSELLGTFATVQYRVRDLYGRQSMQDILSLGTTLDEYIRIISSIRSVFAQRQKLFFAVQNAEHELAKKRQHLEKLLRQGKSQQDRIAQVEKEVSNHEKKVLNLRISYDDISKRIMSEVDRVEKERVTEFRNSVELFLENAIEAQKEAIEVWETFYQRSFLSKEGIASAS